MGRQTIPYLATLTSRDGSQFHSSGTVLCCAEIIKASFLHEKTL